MNDSDAQKCQPIQFNSITFVVNSRSEIANNQWIILYLIEKISEFHRKKVSSSVACQSKLEIAVYDIVSNELAVSDELSVSVLFKFDVSFFALMNCIAQIIFVRVKIRVNFIAHKSSICKIVKAHV